MKKGRIIIFQIVFLLIVSVVSLSVTPDESTVIASAEAKHIRTVILDAGHGGFDGGAEAADGTLEKNINLSIALKLQKILTQGDFEVIMIRATDTGIESDSSQTIAKRKVSDMKKRLEIINSNPGAVFVSIHLNKFITSSAVGAQVFYSPNNDNSMVLAESLQNSFCKLLQPDNERTVKKAGKSIYLLKNAEIPAVIAECGFLSNSDELQLLKNDEYQSKIAFVIYCGIIDYFSKN